MDAFVWNVSPEIFSIGQFGIRWYSLLFLGGIVVSSIILQKWFEKEGKDTVHYESIMTFVVIGTIVGARLGHVIFYQPDYFFSDPIKILKVWEGGLASHGGFIGVIIALYLWVRKKRGSLILLASRSLLHISFCLRRFNTSRQSLQL